MLAERYPDAPNLGDIREIDWSQLVGEVDVITAGFPCQD
ncbi:DNA cytosine methyltransferase [Streptomyces sp. ADI97-07]|nr:DNA cytosine methyltransferase [Streptomyces sp. ADI97-07]